MKIKHFLSQAIQLLKRIPKVKFAVCVVVVLLLIIAATALYTYPDPLPGKAEREKTNTEKNIVSDVTELYPIQVLDIIVPHSIEDIVEAVKNNDHVAIGGGRNSMGGQTASERAVHLDMREYKEVLDFSKEKKEITVQAGARWSDIQNYIDPYDLSIKIMQTYSNFTVGGSLSVNVHGRYAGLGPVIMSVKKMTLVLANGDIVSASPEVNSDLFYSVIGGMGGIAVIADATLELADNVNVERSRTLMSTSDYYQYFKDTVKTDKQVLFHNADMYPPNFSTVSAVNWSETDKESTMKERLIPKTNDYWLERAAWVVMSEWPKGRWIREHIIDPLVYAGEQPVHTRNYEASYDIAELEPGDRDYSTYVLQEYFIPVEKFDEWVPEMKRVFNDNDVNILNVSIRHALPDPGATLAWAKTESFAFVVYYKQGTDEEAKKHAGNWTREMIEEALAVGGTYYLPYQPHATDDQLLRAYPNLPEFFAIKKKYDAANKFTNSLWDKYYSDEQESYYKLRSEEFATVSSTADYFRPADNMYLSIPEWYIVYSADEYAKVLEGSLPSHFSYLSANRDFWSQYDAVTKNNPNLINNDSNYRTVLKVIGVSFSVENFIKAAYENTVGRASEWLAGGRQVPEDKYAATVAREYADFMYDYPWYDFSYFKAFIGVWVLSNDVDHNFGQVLRRVERKLILSVEYLIKSAYSSIIAIATHTKFGVQDDIIYALVSSDGEVSNEIVSAAHYQPFTRALKERMEAELNNEGFSILDISGNQRITLTYLDTVGAEVVSNATEVLRDKEISSSSLNEELYQDRITVEVPVKKIFSVFKELKLRDIEIDHFYDY